MASFVWPDSKFSRKSKRSGFQTSHLSPFVGSMSTVSTFHWTKLSFISNSTEAFLITYFQMLDRFIALDESKNAIQKPLTGSVFWISGKRWQGQNKWCQQPPPPPSPAAAAADLCAAVSVGGITQWQLGEIITIRERGGRARESEEGVGYNGFWGHRGWEALIVTFFSLGKACSGMLEKYKTQVFGAFRGFSVGGCNLFEIKPSTHWPPLCVHVWMHGDPEETSFKRRLRLKRVVDTGRGMWGGVD